MAPASTDADSHKNVPFGDIVDIASHLGGQISRKKTILGHEYAFSSK